MLQTIPRRWSCLLGFLALSACSVAPVKQPVKKEVVKPLPAPPYAPPKSGDLKPEIEIMRENKKPPVSPATSAPAPSVE
jgi:hypothetical protein